ncbi:hypothetical protein KXD40_007262 [Peronospora effusa]|uniref:Uncharacterized protein n=1 Tax=Peronospora effusa TaxID=542832 RepID=A0A3M6VRJ6_9STRA|nr:hypothetical protein DD238_001345 [Peronospora effusa]RQM12559.1 hypothetical protein DD237_006519 [Peronospora effusa]UIZ28883.1 hypothetical protein KXD40_007262 [Peronospora effusa]
MNVQLHDAVVPYLVSPYENFFFLIHHVRLTVESGKAMENTAYQSFSLPLYGIRDWCFHVSFLGMR